MEVLRSICNPRLLGIAIELIRAGTIELLDELTVGRLLFEHMRSMQRLGAAPISASDFADFLNSLASKVLDRFSADIRDDLRLFSIVEESALVAVASSRFFSQVKGSASQYEIKPEGLNLALALYLVAQLERELRNGRNPRERLGSVLEPISALDETANVVLLATQITCLDEESSAEIRAALIERFVSLQNLPNSEVDAFAALVRSAPHAFLQAAESVYLSDEHIAGKNWLLYSLKNHRGNSVVSDQILKWTKRWLSFYSYAPERRMHRTHLHSTVAEVAEERAKVLAEIEARRTGLTEVEQSFIDRNLIEAPNSHFDDLSRFALYLLAGTHLTEAAPYLALWRFSYALNSSTSAPYAVFEKILHLNRVDWQQARGSLLHFLHELPEGHLSAVGRWTRAGVLFCTGDTSDASEGALIVEELTRDRDRFNGWSIRETYCSVDPCDPCSDIAPNVEDTAQRYREIEVERVAIGRGESDHGRLFRGARAAMARFATDVGRNLHNALAEDVLSRAGHSRRQGAWELMRQSAALDRDIALRFLSASVASEASFNGDASARDEFLTAQFSLLIALPHLTADEQFDAIAAMRGETLLLELISCVRMVGPEKLEEVLEGVLLRGDENAQAVTLAAARHSQSVLSPRAVTIVKGFIGSSCSALRQEAIALAASSEERELLQEVVDNGWSATPGRTGLYEGWHGSTSIVKAMQMKLIPTEPALDRICLSHYGFAAEAMPVELTHLIATRVEAALERALEYRAWVDLPDIETGVPALSDVTPPTVSLTERMQPESDLISRMDRLSETEEQFDERQGKMGQAFDRFSCELTTAKAELVLSDLTFDGILAIVGKDADRDARWLSMLTAASDRKVSQLHHFALQVAVAMAGHGNQSAADFATRVLALEPTIRRVTDAAKIPAALSILWSCANSQPVEAIRKRLLRNPQSDSDIARQVFAALLCGHGKRLEGYTEELLALQRPYETALAITISGYCDESAHAAEVLSRFKHAKGFIGTACAAAQDSYDRNKWAKNWYAEMRSSQRTKDFWKASVLFMKVVDGRFDVWRDASNGSSSVFASFMPTIVREINSKSVKTQKVRESTLFGEKIPDPMMLKAE